jgi:hypothetical protein
VLNYRLIRRLVRVMTLLTSKTGIIHLITRQVVLNTVRPVQQVHSIRLLVHSIPRKVLSIHQVALSIRLVTIRVLIIARVVRRVIRALIFLKEVVALEEVIGWDRVWCLGIKVEVQMEV